MVLDRIEKIIETVLHLESYLDLLVKKFGLGTYVIFFLIIFAETGTVFAPFLPGDSLLFALGIISAQGALNVIILFLTLSVAAILGDSLNYSVGKFLGPKVFKESSKYFKKEYLLKTEQFYEKYGHKTIVIARFMPIIRTFAPFVAGIGKMNYARFIIYNIIGGVLWVSVFLLGGYYLGNIPIIKNNFTIAVIIIILLSILPGLVHFIKYKLNNS